MMISEIRIMIIIANMHFIDIITFVSDDDHIYIYAVIMLLFSVFYTINQIIQ